MADTTVRHETHDLVAVAAAADRRAVMPQRLAVCIACLALLGDLRHIALAMPSAAIPIRNRDFRMQAADATRLRRPRRGFGWRLGGARPGRFGAPMRLVGGGLTVAGVVGLLLTTVPSPLPDTGDRDRPTSQAAAGMLPELQATEIASGDGLPVDEGLALPAISGGLVVSGIGALVLSARLRHGSLR